MRRIPGYSLWLGHVGDVRDLSGVHTAGIRAVVNLALNEPPAMLSRELVYCRFPLIDGPGNPRWLLQTAVDTVAGLLRSDTPTLVYCGAGMSRSPCIAGAAIARSAVVPPPRDWPSLFSPRRLTSRRGCGPKFRKSLQETTMDDHYPTIDEPATRDYVLAVLRDEHRQQCQYDEAADPDVWLSLETTVAEWREACDLIPPRELGRALNQMWGIACSDSEWGDVLEPSHRRRLSGVCELIARHATRRRIRPARLLGRNCASAGAFLTIRSLLRQSGADVSELAPLTSLADYTAPPCLPIPGRRLATGSGPPATGPDS